MDLVLRGAMVADGTGGPLRRVDVGVARGRIVAVGDVTSDGVPSVDLTGLVLAPGFVDPHTHYDAQLFWDPDLTPSSWHGVTSVVTGNCGFGIAPMRPEHRGLIAATLENVEGMSREVLAAGIPWTFETFPEYLGAVTTARPRLNVGVMIGHTPVRMFVMGDAAFEREATPEETDAMRAIVVEALRLGALGFTTSMSPTHQGEHGDPVPSRWASWDEVRALAGALTEVDGGVFQATPGPGLDLVALSRLSAETARPVTYTALFTGMGQEPLGVADERGTVLELLERGKALGPGLYPQIASLPQVMQITLEDPFPFAMLPSFREVLSAPRDRRVDVYRTPGWLERARGELPPRWDARWAKTTIDESTAHAELRNGPTLAQLAQRDGRHPFDVLVELSIQEGLRTRFRAVLANDDEDELATLLRDPSCLLAVSDGGAHVSQICDARYSTHLLRHWVREKGVLSLEEAVWRLSGQPAALFGLVDRGRIEPGFAADLVAFDAATVGDDEPRRVFDLPAGGDRLLAGSRGIEHVWVNGTEVVRAGGTFGHDAPGQLLHRGSGAAPPLPPPTLKDGISP